VLVLTSPPSRKRLAITRGGWHPRTTSRVFEAECGPTPIEVERLCDLVA
jgi:hypothetical protein